MSSKEKKNISIPICSQIYYSICCRRYRSNGNALGNLSNSQSKNRKCDGSYEKGIFMVSVAQSDSNPNVSMAFALMM
jgi:hypothetical protein